MVLEAAEHAQQFFSKNHFRTSCRKMHSYRQEYIIEYVNSRLLKEQ